MVTIEYIPGNIVGGATHTLPAAAPDIETAISAVIARPATALNAHAAGANPAAHADGANPVAHANTAIADHVLTQPDNHSLTPDSALTGAVTNALGEDGAGNLETAGGAAVPMTTCIDAHTNMDVDTHVVTNPDAHLQAAIVAALAVHPPADIADALADHVGADAEAATGDITKLTTRTFTLDNDTELGDILTVNYLEVGEQVLVS